MPLETTDGEDLLTTSGQNLYSSEETTVDTLAIAKTVLAHAPEYHFGKKQAGLLSTTTFEHSAGSESGSYEAGGASLDKSDIRNRDLMTALADSQLTGKEVRIVAASPEAQRDQLEPRMLYRGVIQKPRKGQPFTVSIPLVDPLYAMGRPLGPQALWPPLIPRFPDLVSQIEETRKEACPWLFGEKSDVGATDPATGDGREKGLIPAKLLGEINVALTGEPTGIPLYAPELDGPRNAGTYKIAGGTFTNPGYFFAVAIAYDTPEGIKCSEPIMYDSSLRFPGQLALQEATLGITEPFGMRVVWSTHSGSDASTNDYPIAGYYVFMYTWESPWRPFTNPYVEGANPRYKFIANTITDPDPVPLLDGDPTWTPRFNADFSGPDDGDPWPPSATDTTPVTSTDKWWLYALTMHRSAGIFKLHGSNLGNGDEEAKRDRIELNLSVARNDIKAPFLSPDWPYPDPWIELTDDTGKVWHICGFIARGPIAEDHNKGVCNFAASMIGRCDDDGNPYMEFHIAQAAWLLNEIFGGWNAGPQADGTNFPQWSNGVPKVRTSTFFDRQEYTRNILGGFGLEMNWYTDKQQHPTVWVREQNYSSGTTLGQNSEGQTFCAYIDETADTANWKRITDRRIFSDVVWDRGSNVHNWARGYCDHDPDKERFRSALLEYRSEEGYADNDNVWTDDPPFESTMLGRPEHMAWVLKTYLKLHELGDIPVELSGPIDLLNIDTHDKGVLLSTVQGPGASGWVDQPMWIRRRMFDAQTRLASFSLLDVGRIRDALAEVNAEDWASATPTATQAMITLTVTRDLTNAELKAETVLELVAAPPAGYRWSPIIAFVESNFTAGAYTGADASAGYFIELEGPNGYGVSGIQDSSGSSFTDFITATRRVATLIPTQSVYTTPTDLSPTVPERSNMDGRITWRLYNNGSPLGGGHADNKARVILQYAKIPMLP